MQRVRFVKNAREQRNDQQDSYSHYQPQKGHGQIYLWILSWSYLGQVRVTPGILIVVNCFSKMAHFIATQPELNAFTTARILFENIITKHGIPLSIVSDRDSRFGSAVWRELWKMLDTTFGYVYSIPSINRWLNGVHKQDIRANAKMCYYAILDWVGWTFSNNRIML